MNDFNKIEFLLGIYAKKFLDMKYINKKKVIIRMDLNEIRYYDLSDEEKYEKKVCVCNIRKKRQDRHKERQKYVIRNKPSRFIVTTITIF